MKNLLQLQVEQKLNYLLDEAGVSPRDIVIYPQLLKRPLPITKERFQELRWYGCPYNIALTYTCASNELYKKYLNNWKRNRRTSSPFVKFKKFFNAFLFT